MPISFKLHVMRGIADAMHEYHSKDIVHGCLRLSKIRLIINNNTGDIDVKIIGFEEKSIKELYLTPEEFNPNQKPDKTSDVYSCALLFYELLTERYIYSSNTLSNPLQSKEEKDAAGSMFLRSHSPELIRPSFGKDIYMKCDERIFDLIRSMWNPKRKQRPVFYVKIENFDYYAQSTIRDFITDVINDMNIVAVSSLFKPLDYKNVKEWDTRQVIKWLELNEIGEFSQTFKSNNVYGAVLLNLTKQDLRHRLMICNDKYIDDIHNKISQLALDK